jgi:hypothetical protein
MWQMCFPYRAPGNVLAFGTLTIPHTGTGPVASAH